MIKLVLLLCLQSNVADCKLTDTGIRFEDMPKCIRGSIPEAASWLGNHPKWKLKTLFCLIPNQEA